MEIHDILTAIETALAPLLQADLKLKLVVAESPDAALQALQAASPEGGLVVMNPGDDNAPENARGTMTDWEITVSLAAARGLNQGGKDLHKDKPSGRASYLKLWAGVVRLFRRVRFTGDRADREIDCKIHLRYLGSEWLATDDDAAPCRDRMARFRCRFSFDAPGDSIDVPV